MIGRNGVEEVLPLALSRDEEAALRRSAEVVAAAISEVSLPRN